MNDTSPSPPTAILSNLSEASFRFYEPFLKKAVDAWPEETEFRGDAFRTATGYPLSPNTFAARMRDAIVSLYRYHWETTIDTSKLWSIRGEFSIAFGLDGQSVWFRRKGRRGRPSQMVTEAREKGEALVGDAEVVRAPWKDTTPDEVRAVCLLITGGRMSGPVVLNQLLSVDEVAFLSTNYDVAVTVDKEKGQTIII